MYKTPVILEMEKGKVNYCFLFKKKTPVSRKTVPLL